MLSFSRELPPILLPLIVFYSETTGKTKSTQSHCPRSASLFLQSRFGYLWYEAPVTDTTFFKASFVLVHLLPKR